jgi:hypothetical protein
VADVFPELSLEYDLQKTRLDPSLPGIWAKVEFCCWCDVKAM